MERDGAVIYMPRGSSPSGDRRVVKAAAKGSHFMVQRGARTREYEKDGLRHRVFELRANTVGKLDRAERRDAGELPSDIE